ncbi:MAG: TRAP transporter substrate-binding protein DctP [Verrucomicrobia bacterium]|nr:TRAP transporter substrate-binding protein DctP [Verrucomicrobiota bacterium]
MRRNRGAFAPLKWLALGCILGGLAAPRPARAAVRIKLATLAQTGTSFHKSLLKLRDEWRRLSNGSVQLIIYPDGKLGGEAKTVALMRLNAIQASMLTAVGLTEIEKGVEGLQSFPMGFRDLEEVDYVGERLRPLLEKRIEAKGFTVLFWSDTGWVRFFTTKPIRLPEELKRLKLFTWAGDPKTVQLYKMHGFNAIPLETADIVTALETGMIEAVPVPPIFALASQLDRKAKYMLDLNWAPLVGALVVRESAWRRIPTGLRPKLREAAERIGREIKIQARKESEEAVRAMERRGLTVIRLPEPIVEQWRREAQKVYPEIRGRIVPADIFDEAMRLLRERRRGQAASPVS